MKTKIYIGINGTKIYFVIYQKKNFIFESHEKKYFVICGIKIYLGKYKTIK